MRRYAVKTTVGSLDRASLYLAMALALLGVREGVELSRELGADLRNVIGGSSKHRSLPRAIAEFYENTGFEAVEEPDSLVTMLTFIAQLARQDSIEPLKIQHRFLRVHLIPTLTHAVEKCQGLKPFLDIVVEDAGYLKQILTTETESK
ncbi:MAG: hypothetical protein QXX84_05195 [Sulfolobales archaeon]